MKAWTEFLQQQESKFGAHVVKKWLLPLKIIHFDSANLYLEASDSFQLLWFEEHIRPLLKTELLNANCRPIKIHLTLADGAPKQTAKPLAPLLTFASDKLDPHMTLDHFIAGKNASALFRFFCELTGYDPDKKEWLAPTLSLGTFNPIYLWGESGCGKTHLLMALAHALKKRGLNALYAKTETFTEHVVAAIRASEMQLFRKHYRQVDVLLIDDVHLLSRKFATQEEFFHTFNTLHASGRQLIFSSRCTPALLEEIEPRLVSRFEWGINLHFDTLQNEDLKEVLKRKAERLRFPLNEDVYRFLLSSFSSSASLFRSLEALVLRCHLDGDFHFKKDSTLIDSDTARKMLADLLEQEQKVKLCPEKIYAAISALYGIRAKDLLGKSQTQDCSLPRQMAMYLCRQDLKLPFQAIGRLFDRDHSTVMTSVKQIEKKLEEADNETLAALVTLRRHLATNTIYQK